MESLYKETEGEILIKKEFDRSYLLFPIKQNKQEEYSYQMITQNKISGLLNCGIRYVEDNPYYSYEISMKKSLKQEYSDRKMKYVDLKELFFNINVLLKKVSEFLLDKEGFLLEPEYIFTDWESKELECIYLPIKNDGLNNKDRYRNLADFLLDRTDHKDEHAVNVAYQFYKMSKEEYFSFEAFIGFMEKEDLMFLAQERRQEEKKIQTEKKEKIGTEEDRIYETEWKKEREGTTFYGKTSIVLLIVGIFLTGSYFSVTALKSYALYILVPGLTMTFLGVVLLLIGLCQKITNRDMEDEKIMETSVTVEEYFDDILDSETVFFDEEISLLLKWKEGHFSKEYSLMSFPITVGKLKDSVQLYINDDSVSRLHARFTQQEDVIILQDLDSTNGTFVNGKRLAAGEEAIIRRNDEIQFGKIIVNVV